MDDQILLSRAERARSVADVGSLLCDLRRARARRTGERVLSYRSMARDLAWPHTTIGSYFSGRVLPPTNRFDVLVGHLGASAEVWRALATARDRVEDERRRTAPPRTVEALITNNATRLLDTATDMSVRLAATGAAELGGDDLRQADEQISRLMCDFSVCHPDAVTRLCRLHIGLLERLAYLWKHSEYRETAFYAGVTGYLLAFATWSAGDSIRARQHAESAAVFAEIAGRPNLRACVHEIQFQLAMAGGRVHEALRHVRAGMAVAGPAAGTVGVQLPMRAAQAYLALGRPAAARAAVAAAEQAWADLRFDDVDRLLGYTTRENAEPTWLSYMGETYLDFPSAPDSTKVALDWTTSATRALRDPARPGWSHERAVVSKVHQATVLVRNDNLDAAHETALSVATMPTHLRITEIAMSVHRLNDAVRDHPSREGAEISDHLDSFLALPG